MIYKASNGQEIEVVLIRKNNKNIYFRVKDDLKIHVSCPIYLGKENILKMIEKNEESILKMYEKAYENSKDNELFLYLGKKYFIEIKNDIIRMISENAEDGEAAVDIVMIAKYLERIGDHATNIAEWVEFSVTGTHEWME